VKADIKRPTLHLYTIPDAALQVPIICNFGTKEGVTVTNTRFAGTWPSNQVFFNAMRAKGALIGMAVDPFTSHECGNQRYLAIPWLDACLEARLPKKSGGELRPMLKDTAWLAAIGSTEAVPASAYKGDTAQAIWLPNESVAKMWMQYVKDTAVPDTTPPPDPTNLKVNGATLTWNAEADLESGLAQFIIERDGAAIGTVPAQPKNPFGRPIFQGLQYSDTPTMPLVPMTFTDDKAEPGKTHHYRVIAVNTAGLKSQ
jgi:hypothetical protein